MNRHLTFDQIRERVAGQNAAAIMARARTANRLAKTLQGRHRAAAYSVKNDALLALFRTFPDNVRILRDPAEPKEFPHSRAPRCVKSGSLNGIR